MHPGFLHFDARINSRGIPKIYPGPQHIRWLQRHLSTHLQEKRNEKSLIVHLPY